MFKWANIIETAASSVKLGSYDGTWYIEYKSTTYVTISQKLMEEDKIFIHHDNFWQTLPYLFQVMYGYMEHMVR